MRLIILHLAVNVWSTFQFHQSISSRTLTFLKKCQPTEKNKLADGWRKRKLDGRCHSDRSWMSTGREQSPGHMSAVLSLNFLFLEVRTVPQVRLGMSFLCFCRATPQSVHRSVLSETLRWWQINLQNDWTNIAWPPVLSFFSAGV